MHLSDTLRMYGIETSTLTSMAYQRPGEREKYYLLVEREQVLAVWKTLRELVPVTGYWPVIGWLEFEPFDFPAYRVSTQAIIEAGLAIDMDVWFETEKRQILVQKPNFPQNTIWSFISRPENGNLSFPPLDYEIPELRLSRFQENLTPLALLPTKVPWEVPAYFVFAGDHQPAELHVAICKYWYQKYGAEMVSLIMGAIDMHVSSPPQTYEAAYQLAEEQFFYDPDLIYQNVGCLPRLADLLIQSPVWTFWWD